MTVDESTRRLIDQALQGSKLDLDRLLGTVQDRVHALALRMLRNSEDARDATQEILLRVATRLDTFRHESSFSTWVHRVAANHLLNVRRQQAAIEPEAFRKRLSRARSLL